MKKFFKILVLLSLIGSGSIVNAQWQQTNGPSGGNIKALAISGTNIFAGTYSGGVFLSSNNGSSWLAVNNGLAYTEIRSLAISGTNIFAGTESGVFLSSNNGSSWTAVNNGLTNTNVLSLAISGTNIFAGTYGGGVWKRALSEMGVEENNLKTNITLYPNPAKNKVTITNNEPAKETTISIFNITGKQIMSAQFKNQNQIEIDVSTFAEGIYLLRLQNEKEIVNKKLVIQK